jgi:hypothetical protein
MSERISEIKQSLIPENDISDSPIGEIFENKTISSGNRIHLILMI